MNAKNMNLDRRGALKLGLGVAGALVTLNPTARALASMCGHTPQQPEGPFYPVERQLDENNDLTRIRGQRGRASGPLIYVAGTVTDQACEPVAGALVEIWQACASGKYNHPGDSENPAPLDPFFQYWGRTLTDERGRYIFKTVLPGAYPAGDGWMRPPHIHYKVHKRGYVELTTQMYFAGNKYNEGDLILRRLRREERARVIVSLEDPPSDFDPASKVCTFNISLERL